ncbi:MAG: M23 family metallopeptidase [candidate division WOR-3 bacterium]
MNRAFTIIFIGRNNFLKSIFISDRIFIFIFSIFAGITLSTIVLLIHNTKLSIAEMKQNIAEEQYKENSKKIEQLKNCIAGLKRQLDNLITLDNKQRTFLQIASIHPDVWSMGIGGVRNSPRVSNLSVYNTEVLEELYRSIDILKGQVKLREMSLRELENKIIQNYDLWRRVPSINPVPGAEISSGFGYRIDPFEKDVRMHEGLDLTASKGTPVYATADGIVSFADWNMGYGYVVDIEHGYGFVTRYAHLSKILVQEGELVKRGQIIGRVGGTGRAICPHLHYEVIVAGIKVNPINYIDFNNVIFD